MANCVVIGFRQCGQNGKFNPRFGIRTRRIVSGKGSSRRLAIAALLGLSCLRTIVQAETGYDLLRRCDGAEDPNNPVRYQDSAFCQALFTAYRMEQIQPLPFKTARHCSAFLSHHRRSVS
jgi:hypothetical protein